MPSCNCLYPEHPQVLQPDLLNFFLACCIISIVLLWLSNFSIFFWNGDAQNLHSTPIIVSVTPDKEEQWLHSFCSRVSSNITQYWELALLVGTLHRWLLLSGSISKFFSKVELCLFMFYVIPVSPLFQGVQMAYRGSSNCLTSLWSKVHWEIEIFGTVSSLLGCYNGYVGMALGDGTMRRNQGNK